MFTKPFAYASLVLEGWRGTPISDDESPATERLMGTDSLGQVPNRGSGCIFKAKNKVTKMKVKRKAI